MGGRQHDGIVISDQRLVETPQVAQQGAEIVPGVGITGIEGNGPVVTGQRLIQPSSDHKARRRDC